MQYGEFARIYDRLMHRDIDYGKWCDYIEKLFEVSGCKPQTVCELACGTGNITARLAARGYEMTGVDISADMLAAGDRKLKNIQVFCADMSKFAPLQKYDAFLCMIDGINYVLVPSALMRTFKNVKAALTTGGVFIFDISTVHKLKNIIGNETFIHSEYDIFYSWQNEFIEKYRISDMLLNFFVRKGGRYVRFEERHAQRGWTVWEITELLRRAGFSEIGIYDELTTAPPHRHSERVVFVCK